MKKRKPRPTNVANVVPTVRKPKKVGKNAAQRKLDADWEAMLAKHAGPLEKGARAKGVDVAPKPTKRRSRHVEHVSMVPTLTAPPGRQGPKLPSKVTPGGSTAKKDTQQYTGTNMLGVATMHKSNTVPVFSQQEADDIAKMRRNEYDRSK